MQTEPWDTSKRAADGAKRGIDDATRRSADRAARRRLTGALYERLALGGRDARLFVSYGDEREVRACIVMLLRWCHARVS